MEFLPAMSLREAVRTHGPLSDGAVWSLAAGLAEALASIHDAGVLHLDLKPGNVLLTEEGPRVIDFGIADGAGAGAGGSTHTAAGSPGFMSPEQLTSAGIEPASDVFAYGATLAYALTSTPRLDSIDSPLTGADLRLLVARCLAPEPAARPTVGDLVAATRGGERGTVSLPAGVLTEIHRRASEAENPPVTLSTMSPATLRMSRRALLIAGGLAVLAGEAATAMVLSADERVPGTAHPGAPSQPATTLVPLAPITAYGNRMLMILVTGDATVYTLTTTVNGLPETVTNMVPPLRRIAEIPPSPAYSTWQIYYHHSPGTFTFQVIVDGHVYASGGDSDGQDVRDAKEGSV
jgi:serine/threonine protein kinase